MERIQNAAITKKQKTTKVTFSPEWLGILAEFLFEALVGPDTQSY